jgi:hypothetical protein
MNALTFEMARRWRSRASRIARRRSGSSPAGQACGTSAKSSSPPYPSAAIRAIVSSIENFW